MNSTSIKINSYLKCFSEDTNELNIAPTKRPGRQTFFAGLNKKRPLENAFFFSSRFSILSVGLISIRSKS